MLRRWVGFLLVVSAVFGLLGCGGGAGRSPTSPTSTEALVQESKNVVTGTIIVPPNGSRDITFDVDATTQRNIRLVGWIHASGGSQNEIEVFVANDTDYQSWQQGRKVTPIYNSGRTTLADVDVKIPAAMTRYHLVFNNVFSSSLKTVQAQLDLKYYVPAPTTTP